MTPFAIRPTLACLIPVALALGGCDGGRPRPPSFDTAAEHLRISNIAPWNGGRSGTNRWVGEPADALPTVDVVVPDARSTAEAPLASAAHEAVAEVNRRMAGLLLLRDVPPGASRQVSHIEVSYLTAYVPPAVIDDSGYCSNVSDARGQGAPFRPGPDGHRNHGIAWVNLGNGHCTVRTGQVVHQLATALGLDAPFPSFGPHGPAASDGLWEALSLLYANPVRTPAAALQPRRRDSLPGPAPTDDNGQPTIPYVSGP